MESIREMIRQRGERLETAGGIARRGVIIRHMILPGRVQNSLDVVHLIASHLSTHVPLSLLSQYTPTPVVSGDPRFCRRVTQGEYERVVDRALDLGFENLFIQDVDDRDLSPDFEKTDPFRWDQG
jgi:putative pyruvate formate lyase activating enzyme